MNAHELEQLYKDVTSTVTHSLAAALEYPHESEEDIRLNLSGVLCTINSVYNMLRRYADIDPRLKNKKEYFVEITYKDK